MRREGADFESIHKGKRGPECLGVRASEWQRLALNQPAARPEQLAHLIAKAKHPPRGDHRAGPAFRLGQEGCAAKPARYHDAAMVLYQPYSLSVVRVPSGGLFLLRGTIVADKRISSASR